ARPARVLTLASRVALYGPKILTGEVGGSITIKCVYRPIKANRYDRKYWCKISGTRRVCNTIISTNNFISKDYKGRASLTDFPKNGTFTIQMTQLEQNDAGAYRYGIGNNNKALFVSMKLTVLESTVAGDLHNRLIAKGTDPNLSSESATPDLKYSGATFTESKREIVPHELGVALRCFGIACAWEAQRVSDNTMPT
uniref:Immunoglobulin V-set domain-containing protein n=1 Tax=Terrapene triunguis TaxID=2587831 RepID=A0A674JIF9_9SAUR